MSINFNKPSILWWILAPIIIILGLLAGNKTLDIQIHDTYYVFGYLNLTFMLFAYTILIGSVYRFIELKNLTPKKTLIKFHIIISTIGMITLMTIASLTGFLTDGQNIRMNMQISYSFIILIFISIFSLILGLFIMTFNVISALRSNERTS